MLTKTSFNSLELKTPELGDGQGRTYFQRPSQCRAGSRQDSLYLPSPCFRPRKERCILFQVISPRVLGCVPFPILIMCRPRTPRTQSAVRCTVCVWRYDLGQRMHPCNAWLLGHRVAFPCSSCTEMSVKETLYRISKEQALVWVAKEASRIVRPRRLCL